MSFQHLRQLLRPPFARGKTGNWFSQIHWEFFRFLVCGFANTVAGYAIYLALLVALPYQIAWAGSFVLGILLSYYLNSRFVFRQPVRLGAAVKFPLVYLVQYLVSAALLHYGVEMINVDTTLAPALAIVGTIPITYFASRLIIAGRRPVGPPVDSAAADQLLDDRERGDASP